MKKTIRETQSFYIPKQIGTYEQIPVEILEDFELKFEFIRDLTYPGAKYMHRNPDGFIELPSGRKPIVIKNESFELIKDIIASNGKLSVIDNKAIQHIFYTHYFCSPPKS